MLDILQAILAFVVLIAILVFIHELGHFLAARWCGMQADVFAIGMGPRLFGWNKKNGFTFGKVPDDLDLNGGTDYRVAAFPIGGYVKIAGMVDESMDTEFANRKPEPWEFRSKSTLQKAFVISAGVIMNVILALIVFTGINFFVPKDLKLTQKIGPVPHDSQGYSAGFRTGDKILKVGDQPIVTFEDISRQVYQEQAEVDPLHFTIERNGTVQTIDVPQSEVPQPGTPEFPLIPYADQEAIGITSVQSDKPAEEAGFEPDDIIRTIDGIPILSREQIQEYITHHKGQELTIEVERNKQLLTKKVVPNDDGIIGVGLGSIYEGPTKPETYGLGKSFTTAVSQSTGVVKNIVNLIGALFTGKAKLKDSVGGPLAIASYAKQSASQGLPSYLMLLGILSVTLAVMNILPIPALDGGHLVFIIIEGIIRREVPLKVRMAIQQAGVVLLLIFMAFVLYNDFSKVFFNN